MINSEFTNLADNHTAQVWSFDKEGTETFGLIIRDGNGVAVHFDHYSSREAVNEVIATLYEAPRKSSMLAPREMREGMQVITVEHGLITLTEAPTAMRGATNKSVLAGTTVSGEAVYVIRSRFLSIVCYI